MRQVLSVGVGGGRALADSQTQELSFFWVASLANLGAGDCDISMMVELEAFLDLSHPPTS